MCVYPLRRVWVNPGLSCGAGTLMRWDTSSGRMMTVATGNGAVRRIHFAPPAPPELAYSGLAGAELQARVAVLFASGAFGVWELDSRSELRQVRSRV